MIDILKNIADYMYRDVARRRKIISEEVLEKSCFFDRSCRSFAAVARTPGMHIIAEYKKRSPSKGDINTWADPLETALHYQRAGASAISVLTNRRFFNGSSEYLTHMANYVDIPLLRKEFILDPYQIIESKSIGADMILLIAELLTAQEVAEYTARAQDLGMEVLLELHSRDQLEKISGKEDCIGINNRDLSSFVVNIDRSIDLVGQLPDSTVTVAESGLSDPATVQRMSSAGFQAFLIGEQFMKESLPGDACELFINGLM
ncbi:MAG: indole-3-glycerol phosphate synthase TrpC [Fibrobacterota bacterium]